MSGIDAAADRHACVCQSDDDGLDLEEVVNSAFRHLREDLTHRASRTSSSEALSITRHVTQTSSTSSSVSARQSRLPQNSSSTSKLSTCTPQQATAAADSSVVKAHSGQYY